MSYENKSSDTGNVDFGVQEDIDLGNKYALSISFSRLNFYMVYQVSALLEKPNTSYIGAKQSTDRRAMYWFKQKKRKIMTSSS